MGSKWRSFRSPRISLAVQQGHMHAVWPELESRIERGMLIIRGRVHPSPLTETYTMRLTYRLGGAPQLHVVSPKLERRPGEPDAPIPHTYNSSTPGSERPCVYYPDGREWTPAMLLATTIMPWLLAWLVDYELWRATGQWFGGGIAHGGRERRDEPSPKDEEAA